MGAVMIVVFTPGCDQVPGVAQVGEQVLIQALIPEAVCCRKSAGRDRQFPETAW